MQALWRKADVYPQLALRLPQRLSSNSVMACLLHFFEAPTGRESWLNLTGLSRRRPWSSGTANAETFRNLDKEISTFE